LSSNPSTEERKEGRERKGRREEGKGGRKEGKKDGALSSNSSTAKKKVLKSINMTKVHYMHVWKCHNETVYTI
jgi:hypothetical protein